MTGWIKRGPSGVIGTNKQCSIETVTCLLDDYAHGRLIPPAAGLRSLFDLMRERKPDAIDYEGWQTIDKFEQTIGQRAGRPRIKIVDTKTMLEAASATSHPETVVHQRDRSNSGGWY